jgi:TDG/mug DNA glycosylase family protein
MQTQDRKRPTRAELAAAEGAHLPDIIRPGLKVLFCGINPGLYSAAIGHHFGRPGNRFWAALRSGGFTDRLLTAWEDQELLQFGCGLTNLVERASARADQLGPTELVAGRAELERKIRRYRPRWIAILGIGAYRTAFNRPQSSPGIQTDRLGGAGVWVLPNPSGLNAHHQPHQLAVLFQELRETAFDQPPNEHLQLTAVR